MWRRGNRGFERRSGLSDCRCSRNSAVHTARNATAPSATAKAVAAPAFPHGQHSDRRRQGGVYRRDDGRRVAQEVAPRPQAATLERQIARGKAALVVVGGLVLK